MTTATLPASDEVKYTAERPRWPFVFAIGERCTGCVDAI